MRAGCAILVLHLSFVCVVLAEPSQLADTFIGYNFTDAFTWTTDDDPTHGRVNYVNKDVALQKNLSYGAPTLPFHPFAYMLISNR